MISRVSHVDLLDAARAVTGARNLFVAGWSAKGGPGTHVGTGFGAAEVIFADGATRDEVLAQLRAPVALVPVVDAIGRTLLATRKGAR